MSFSVSRQEIMPDDPGDDLKILGYRGDGYNAPPLPIPGVHFEEGNPIPMHHRATGKWYINGRILEWVDGELQ